MICERCGSAEADDAVYCSSCGALLAPPAPPASTETRQFRVTTASAGPLRQPARASSPGSPDDGSGTFISALFDIDFKSFVAIKVIKVVYVLIMILLGLSAVSYAIFAFRIDTLFGVISLVILCPLYFFICLALWRIVLEVIVVVFRIAEDLHAIRLRGDAPGPLAHGPGPAGQADAYDAATVRDH
jgi:hypothetical protein